MLTLTDLGAEAVLADLVDLTVAANHTGALAAVVLALFTDANPIAGGSVLADKVEATYTGYARSATLAWDPPYRGADGLWRITSQRLHFAATDAVNPNTITAVGLIHGIGGAAVLWGGEVLDTTVQLAKAGDGFDYVVQFVLPFGPYGDGNVIR